MTETVWGNALLDTLQKKHDVFIKGKFTVAGIIAQQAADELIQERTKILVLHIDVHHGDLFVEVGEELPENGGLADITVPEEGDVLPVSLFKVKDPFFNNSIMAVRPKNPVVRSYD